MSATETALTAQRIVAGGHPCDDFLCLVVKELDRDNSSPTLPGLALASAIRSLTDLAGSEGGTLKTSGEAEAIATGTKSLRLSYGSFR